jgi:uncharacterized protein YjbJ (UPF0337 family)
MDLNGSWSKTKAKLKHKFAMVMGNDVLILEGKEDAMLARLQLKFGKSRAEIKKIIAGL